MNKNAQHEIVIVGAGPAGLALAAELQRLGIPSLIFDRLAEGRNTSRAAVIHARTLEVLEPLGVAQELLAAGLKISIFRVRDRNKVLATINFEGLETAYPYGLLCPQDRTEAILLRRLTALGGTVERPREVVAIHPGESSIQVHWRSGEEQGAVEAKWVVGCDGMHSIVREQAGIDFAGGSYEETFLLADVEMDWPIARDEVSLFTAPEGLLLVAPLPPVTSASSRRLKKRQQSQRLLTSSESSSSAAPTAARLRSAMSPGPRATTSTIAWRKPFAPAGSCSPATRPTCTARRVDRA